MGPEQSVLLGHWHLHLEHFVGDPGHGEFPELVRPEGASRNGVTAVVDCKSSMTVGCSASSFWAW